MKQRQREGTEPNKGTVRERKRASPAAPEERTTDRDLGAPSPATAPYRSGDTEGEILGKEHLEKTDEQRIPQRKDALRGAKLSVRLRSTQERQTERERISALSDIAESRQQRGHKLEWPAN